MSRLTNAISQFLPSTWTDHALMTVDLLPARNDFGRGTWRFNPTLLSNEGFVALLDNTTDMFFEELEHETVPENCRSPQLQWESFKQMLKYTAQRFSQGSTTRLNRKLPALQLTRQALLTEQLHSQHSQHTSTINTQLQHIEEQIDKLTQQQTQHAILRSATRWHEKGERNNKYFYR
ncbi:hypothetical protein K492DRAFT_135769, partial [Lichtheimia hyalospora FSU 10163]